MIGTTAMRPTDACPYCSSDGQWTIHPGKCPKVKAIEYHQNGAVKRVEFCDSPEPDKETPRVRLLDLGDDAGYTGRGPWNAGG